MLSDALKKAIQGNYSLLLQRKQLQTRPGQKLMIAEIAKTLAGVSSDAEGRRSAAASVTAGIGFCEMWKGRSGPSSQAHIWRMSTTLRSTKFRSPGHAASATLSSVAGTLSRYCIS